MQLELEQSTNVAIVLVTGGLHVGRDAEDRNILF